MKRETELRARLRWLIERQRHEIIRQVYAVVQLLHNGWPQVSTDELLSSTRINSLRFVAHPYQYRLTATERLAHMQAELDRMHKQAEDNTPQQAFYAQLQTLLWLNPDKEPPWPRLLEKLKLKKNEEAEWRDIGRLMLAGAVLDTLAAIYTTQPLQQELDSKRKAEGGYRLCL